MLRLVVSKVPSGMRFKRFWVPSLDQIEKSVRPQSMKGDGAFTTDPGSVTELIGHVRIGGTNKSTSPARLGSADGALLDQLERFPSDCLSFLDVGCSDGTTSIDTIERMEQALRVRLTGYLMDRYIWIRRSSRWRIVEYVGTEGGLVMVRCGPIALAPVPSTFWLAPLTNRAVSAYLGLTSFRKGMRETARFPLLSPRVRARTDVHICEGSVLTLNEEFLGRMHVVRVSNLLHADYFSEEEISRGLSNLTRYLRDGGFIVVSRNVEQDGAESERGTVWRRVGDTLSPVADFGGGSELKRFVDSIRLIGSVGAG